MLLAFTVKHHAELHLRSVQDYTYMSSQIVIIVTPFP